MAVNGIIFMVLLLGILEWGCCSEQLCDDDWTEYDGSCYTVASPFTMNVTQAQNQCLALGSNLVSIGSESEQHFIENTLFVSGYALDHWTGLRRTAGSDWTWVDGTQYTYTNWELGQPRSWAEAVLVVLRQGQWFWRGVADTTTSYSRPICEKSVHQPKSTAVTLDATSDISELTDGKSRVTAAATADQTGGYTLKSTEKETSETRDLTFSSTVVTATSTPSTDRKFEDFCDEAWLGYDGSCYTISKPATMTFTEAHNQCLVLNSNLVSIGSEQEQLFIENRILDSRFAIHHWIGLHRTPGSEWTWIDGTPYIYAKWQSGQPPLWAERAFIVLENNHWFWRGLSDSVRGYSRSLCEKPANQVNSTTANVDEAFDNSSVTAARQTAQTKLIMRLYGAIGATTSLAVTFMVACVAVLVKTRRDRHSVSPTLKGKEDEIEYENSNKPNGVSPTIPRGAGTSVRAAAAKGGLADPIATSNGDTGDHERPRDNDTVQYESLQNTEEITPVAYDSLQHRNDNH